MLAMPGLPEELPEACCQHGSNVHLRQGAEHDLRILDDELVVCQGVHLLLLLCFGELGPDAERVHHDHSSVLHAERLQGCGCHVPPPCHCDVVEAMPLLEFHLQLPPDLITLGASCGHSPGGEDHDLQHGRVGATKDPCVLEQASLLFRQQLPCPLLQLGNASVSFIDLLLVDCLHLGIVPPVQEARVGNGTNIALDEAHDRQVHRLLSPNGSCSVVLGLPPLLHDAEEEAGRVALLPLSEHQLCGSVRAELLRLPVADCALHPFLVLDVHIFNEVLPLLALGIHALFAILE
mmetsp:Transcript_45758/g.99402  ORF Transcript_45758/g.99402 Transcript_45758/m.99402 type:complete len:292 (+) Transcript_45758:475-1350(+)